MRQTVQAFLNAGCARVPVAVHVAPAGAASPQHKVLAVLRGRPLKSVRDNGPRGRGGVTRGRFVRVAGVAVERTSGPQPEGVDVRRLAPALALGVLLLLAWPASADCVVGHQGPCDDVISSGGRGSATTAPPTTSSVPEQPTTTTVPEQQPMTSTSGVASEDTVPEVTVAETGEELPFTGTSATVILAAAGVFLAAGALAFFVARTKPKH
jgi:LPXTG-motif cell wall-anchored protein